MEHFERMKQNLKAARIYYAGYQYFEQLDYNRDVVVHVWPENNRKAIKIILKDVVSIDYKSDLKGGQFNISDAYINKPQPLPLKSLYWGIRSFPLSTYLLENESKEIAELQGDYDFKLFKLTLKVVHCTISFIFHDLEIVQIE